MAKVSRKNARNTDDDDATSKMKLRPSDSRKLPSKLQPTPAKKKMKGGKEKAAPEATPVKGNGMKEKDKRSREVPQESDSRTLSLGSKMRPTERMKVILENLRTERRMKKLSAIKTPPAPVHAKEKSTPSKKDKVRSLPVRQTPPRNSKKPRLNPTPSQGSSRVEDVVNGVLNGLSDVLNGAPASVVGHESENVVAPTVDPPNPANPVPFVARQSPRKLGKKSKMPRPTKKSKTPSPPSRSPSPLREIYGDQPEALRTRSATPMPEPSDRRPAPPEFDEEGDREESDLPEEELPNPHNAPSIRCINACNRNGKDHMSFF